MNDNDVKEIITETAREAYQKGLNDAADEVERRQAEREAARRKPMEDEIEKRIKKYEHGRD